MAEFSLKLEFKWLFSPSVSAKQELIIAHCYHVCYHVVLRLWVNLKLIKDTRPRSLLTRVFTFPAPVFFLTASCIHLSLTVATVWEYEQMEGDLAAWCQVEKQWRECWKKRRREWREACVCSRSHGTAVQSAPTYDKTAVTHPRSTPIVDFSRSLTSLAVDVDEKSPDVFLCLVLFFLITLHSFFPFPDRLPLLGPAVSNAESL